MAPDGQHWDVGAYVLGVLDPAEVEPFEAHLAVCDYCADEVTSLLPVVGRLAGAAATASVGPTDAREDAPRRPPPSWLPDSVPHRHGRSVPRHGRLVQPVANHPRLLAAAGVAAVLVSGVSFLAGSQWATPDLSAGGPPGVSGSTGPQQRFEATDPTTGVHARVGLVAARWGTQVDLTLDGVRGPLRCELVAIDQGGHSTVVASWTVSEPGYGIAEQPDPLRLAAATAATVEATARLEIRGTNPAGAIATLVTLPV